MILKICRCCILISYSANMHISKILKKNVKDGWMIVYILSKKISDILSNLDQTETLVDNLISWHGYLQDNQDLVLHNLQADADDQPWSTIIINNLVDHALGKLCQTMVNHGWLRCYLTNLWLTMVDHGLGIKLCQTMVNHGWLRCHFTNRWLTIILIKLCQTTVNHGWLKCHFTNHGWPWFVTFMLIAVN